MADVIICLLCRDYKPRESFPGVRTATANRGICQSCDEARLPPKGTIYCSRCGNRFAVKDATYPILPDARRGLCPGCDTPEDARRREIQKGRSSRVHHRIKCVHCVEMKPPDAFPPMSPYSNKGKCFECRARRKQEDQGRPLTPPAPRVYTLPEVISEAMDWAEVRGAKRFWVAREGKGYKVVTKEPEGSPILISCVLRERHEWRDTATGEIVGRGGW